MKRLKDKICLVTGASDGIGYEVSRACAEEDAAVVLLARSEDKLNERVDFLKSKGLAAHAFRGDVGSTEDVAACIRWMEDEFGRVDVLVNNAAVAIPGDITEEGDKEWNHLLNINLLSVFRGIKFALPGMLKRKAGSIINMASVQGDRSWDHWTTYAAAKGGMKAMTRQLAGQYGRSGVRFNCISPGAIDTPMNQRRAEKEGPELYETYERLHALGRIGRADEVNGAAVFLASDESTFVTGIDMLVDGGLSVLTRD